MERSKLYIKQIKDGVETPFPSDAYPAVISKYTYDATRMGSAPTITATFMHPLCLDDLWTYNEYVEYKGEKYYVRQIPTSIKSYEDARYQHDITLVSEREILGNEYFYDVVTADTDAQYKDRYRSNLSDFNFRGDLKEFVARLNDSLIYTKLYDKETGEGYYVVIDDGIESKDTVDIQFSNKYIVEALQEINTSFKQAYYFVGKTIHVGYTENDINTIFEYGKGNGLLKVEKQNANTKLVDRITGTGSSDNLPYYYPNTTPYGIAIWKSDGGSVSPEVEDINISTINKYAGDAMGKSFVLCYHPTEASVSFDKEFAHSHQEWNILPDKEWFENYIPGRGGSYYEKKVEITTTTYSRAYYLNNGDIVSVKNLGEPTYFNYWYGTDFSIKTITGNGGCIFQKKQKEVYLYAVSQNAITGTELDRTLIPLSGETSFMVASKNTKVFFMAIAIWECTFGFKAWEDNKNGYVLYAENNLTVPNFKISHDYTSEFSKSGYVFQYGKDLHGAHYMLPTIAYENSGIKLRNLEKLVCARFKVEFIDTNPSNYPFGFVQTVESSPVPPTRITITGRQWVMPSSKLMPSIYRNTLGAERYYNAENNKYEKENGGYYVFNNLYEESNPHSAIKEFEKIKPTIKDVVNSKGQLLGEIAAIAFDDNDNDEVKNSSSSSKEYIHPYFYIKLHKFDGDAGFNLFDSALESGKATIEMTSGNCIGCKFEIGVPNPTKVSEGKYVFHNPVQVDGNGNIVAGDSEDKVKVNSYQDRQQDTSKNEVWIALKKEESTYNMVVPNASQKLRPSAGDTFVITNISLPKSYIYAAEKRLDAALVKSMAENNTEKFNFSIMFSRIYLANNPDIARKLNENARITIRYNGYNIPLFVTNYSVKADDDVLEEVVVELNEDLTIAQSNFSLRLQEMKNDIVETIAGLDLHLATKPYYLSRRDENLSGDDERTAQGKLFLKGGADFGTFITGEQGAQIDADGRAELMSLFVRSLMQSVNFETGENGKGFKIWNDDNGVSHIELDEITLRNALQSNTFASGFNGEGFKLWKDENGYANLELDRLTVRQIMTVFELVIDKIRSVGGNIVVSAANGKIKEILETEDNYVITFEDECYFRENDFMRCQTYTGTDKRGYWVEISGSGSDFVTVPKSEFSEWNAIPKVGDEVVLMGNSTNPNRQNLISISATEDGQPRIDVLNGVHEKNFTNGLRARLGNLDGIKDDWFPVDNQPHGDGLYADNAYLRGTFLLTTGEDIKTKFEIIEGKITSSVESVRKDLEDGFIRNGSFMDGTAFWNVDNDVDVFSLSSRFVWANESVLSHIQGGASLIKDGDRTVMRIINGMIVQKSENYRNIPEFEVNDNGLYEPIPVTLTFFYKIKNEGNIAVFFENIDKTGFEDFDEFTYEGEMSASDDYREFSASGLWNGTGDFTLYFEGEIMLHSIVLKTDSSDRLAYKYRTLFEQSDKIVRIAAENFDINGKVIEQSDIITTAKYNTLMSKYFNEDGSLVNLAGVVTTTDFNAFKKDNGTTISGIFDDIIALNAGLNDTRDDINTNYVKIEAFSGMFASAVDENGIAKTSQLSSYVAKQTGEDGKTYLESGVLAKADNIVLEGYTTINSNFHIDENGKMYAKNGEFDGDLNVATLGYKIDQATDEGILNCAFISNGIYILPTLEPGECQVLMAFDTKFTKPYLITLKCTGRNYIMIEEIDSAGLPHWDSSQRINLAGFFYIVGIRESDYFEDTYWYVIPLSKWWSAEKVTE